MIEYGEPLITRWGNKRIITNYVELERDEETGCLNEKRKHGRHIVYDTRGHIEHYGLYQHNKPIGIHYTWEHNFGNNNHHLANITSHEQDGGMIEYDLFINGNLKEITYPQDCKTGRMCDEFQHKTGFISNRYLNDDTYEIHAEYTRGRVRRIRALQRGMKCGYNITYVESSQVLMTTGHYVCDYNYATSIKPCSTDQMGFLLTRVVSQPGTYLLRFMNGEQDMTAQIKSMVVDFTDIQPEEEAMIQLAFGNTFCVILPEVVRNELKNKNAKII